MTESDTELLQMAAKAAAKTWPLVGYELRSKLA